MDDANVAQQTAIDLDDVLYRGGFEVRKWISNNPTSLPRQLDAKVNAESVDLDLDPTPQRTLGVLWNFKLDELKVAYTEKEQHFTKRGLLSEASFVIDLSGL